MKPLILALALYLPAATAFAACPAGLPKIVGLDYHTARAKLINARFAPVITRAETLTVKPFEMENVPPYMRNLGYLEGDGAMTGNAFADFKWHGFTVYAKYCEAPGEPRDIKGFVECVVYKVACP